MGTRKLEILSAVIPACVRMTTFFEFRNTLLRGNAYLLLKIPSAFPRSGRGNENGREYFEFRDSLLQREENHPWFLLDPSITKINKLQGLLGNFAFEQFDGFL